MMHGIQPEKWWAAVYFCPPDWRVARMHIIRSCSAKGYIMKRVRDCKKIVSI